MTVQQRRHEAFQPDPTNVLELNDDHPAIVGRTSVYPSTIVDAGQAPRLLVGGFNSRKIGREVAKGPWAGMPIFTLTLVERETCPEHCSNWGSCYGNAMHLARRHRPSREFEDRLADEVLDLCHRHSSGFVVRLHVLGDFYSVEYTRLWEAMLRKWEALRIYGYTAHSTAAPEASSVYLAQIITRMNAEYPDRCAIRFSGPKKQRMGAVVIDRWPEQSVVPEGLVCPAETTDAECCATCGLCWSPTTRERSIVFIRHGRQKLMRHRPQPLIAEPVTKPDGDWEEFMPDTVGRGRKGPQVIANRVTDPKGRSRIRIYLNLALLRELSWLPGAPVSIHFGRGDNDGRLLVRPTPRGALKLTKVQSGAAQLMVRGYPAPWPDSDGRFILPHTIIDGNLVLDLPVTDSRAAA
ncbi:MAG: hypothetical protein AB7I42_26595 [Bradyrhizobium sp.]|uniref:GP88 family protein n=1 Tax=Bradyrhizobium sp. TaxID=376 RepID=UPI003D112D7E